MNNPVTIDTVKPENLKDGYDVKIKEKEYYKEEIDLSQENPEGLKSGFKVNIKNLENPKTY